MPLPAALAARLAKRGLITGSEKHESGKKESKKKVHEEVIAEDYDNTKEEINQIDISQKFMGYNGCPNKYNIYHECTKKCKELWGMGHVQPSDKYLKQQMRLIQKYPLPETWKAVYDPGSGQHYYWDWSSDLVSWLPPGHPKCQISQPASQLREELHLKAGDQDDNMSSDDSTSDQEQMEVEESEPVKKDRKIENRTRYKGPDNKRTYRSDRNDGKDIKDRTLDPMDPASYSDIPRGKWSDGLAKHNEAKTGADTTASGPLYQMRPYPSPGAVLRSNRANKAESESSNKPKVAFPASSALEGFPGSYPVPNGNRDWIHPLSAASQDDEGNCSERSIKEFPEVFTYAQRRQGVVVLHILFGFYCFILTAFVCNDYLLPALDVICTRLNISTDVAGATFLATASCFPELFVNVVGTFLTESDLGVGTVMGGAVFNTFATPACGALSAMHAISLEWRILTRDCVIYVISVAVLVIVMWDGIIKLYEAIILMVLFISYLIILFSSKCIARWYNKLAHLYTCKTHSTNLTEEEIPKRNGELMSDGLYRPYFHGELVIEYRRSIASRKPSVNGLEAQDHVHEIEEYVEPDTPFVWPAGGSLAKIWFCFVWPLKLILFVTIPDSRYKRWQNWYLLTFIMCVLWIAVSSYLTSWMTTVLGDTIGIPDSVMGITFQAAGGNMPELVSIVILSRQGNGDMAMSNTLGANTLDILLCLGLPWLIKILLDGKDIAIVSGALRFSVLSIIACVIAFYVVTAFYKYRLNKKVGAICLILYAIFLVFALSFELNVFFPVNLPMCPT